ncbi:ATP-binding cassette domain-containing protein [Lysinibacillus fusiformis]|nr:ATP-binding cassette domain-containing protein [Lysinibacillus fusiformis]
MELMLKNVVKKYNGTSILDGVSATFKGGTCYLLLGQNGAGKSTLAKCMVGDEKVDTGSILLKGSTSQVFEEIAIQYQTFESYKHLNIREIIQLFKKLTKNAYYSEELYEILGIESYKRVLLKNASGGQRKAVSIFLAFLLNKPIILLDEPFADLDLMKKKQLLLFLQTTMQQQSKILIIINHY